MATCGKCTQTGVTVAHVKACYGQVAAVDQHAAARDAAMAQRVAAEKRRVSTILHGDNPSTQRSTYRSTYYATPYETRGSLGDSEPEQRGAYLRPEETVDVPGLPGVRVPQDSSYPTSAIPGSVWAPVDALRTQVVEHLHYETSQGGTTKRVGHFAVYVYDNELKFLRVKKILSGRYAGRVFVDSMGSDTGYPVKTPDTLTTYLTAILVDPVAAAKRYADELGQCSDCGRDLTNEESRARGIGPDCWAKR